MFVQYDLKIKRDIIGYNTSVMTKTQGITAGRLRSQESFFNAGWVLPKTLPNSSNYFKRKLLDLTAIASAKGTCHLLLTLTLDSNWPELSSFGEPSTWHPIESLLAFRRRYQTLSSQFDDDLIFGKIKYMWKRIEYQMRGAIHAHILIWLDPPPTVDIFEGRHADRLVSARVPRIEDA